LGIVSESLRTGIIGSAGPWISLTFFLSIVGIVSNFLSSTVCALIAVPIVAQVGLSMDHPRLFVVATALMISAAMALPVSSFPNANAGATGAVAASDFSRSGSIVALVFFGLLVTVGYLWGLMLGL
jgi:di/tricarboxylate transporter